MDNSWNWNIDSFVVHLDAIPLDCIRQIRACRRWYIRDLPWRNWMIHWGQGRHNNLWLWWRRWMLFLSWNLGAIVLDTREAVVQFYGVCDMYIDVREKKVLLWVGSSSSNKSKKKDYNTHGTVKEKLTLSSFVQPLLLFISGCHPAVLQFPYGAAGAPFKTFLVHPTFCVGQFPLEFGYIAEQHALGVVWNMWLIMVLSSQSFGSVRWCVCVCVYMFVCLFVCI